MSFGNVVAGAVAGGQVSAMPPTVGYFVGAGADSEGVGEFGAGGQAYVTGEGEGTPGREVAQFVEGADEAPRYQFVYDKLPYAASRSYVHYESAVHEG